MTKQFIINDVRVLTHNQILEILNQLIEENEQFKKGILNKEQVIFGLKEDIKRCRKRISDLSFDKSMLEEENEQLKQEIKNIIRANNPF